MPRRGTKRSLTESSITDTESVSDDSDAGWEPEPPISRDTRKSVPVRQLVLALHLRSRFTKVSNLPHPFHADPKGKKGKNTNSETTSREGKISSEKAQSKQLSPGNLFVIFSTCCSFWGECSPG